MAIKWTDDLSVGFDTIDDQHKELISRLDKFVQSMMEGRGKAEVEEILKFLGKYVEEHFSTEEAYMSKFDYPDKEEHRKEHELFRETYRAILDDVRKDGVKSTTVLRVHKSMFDWFRNHIHNVDKKLGPFLHDAVRKQK